MPVKKGVTIGKLTPQMALAYADVKHIYFEYGFPCTITSGDDGTHSAHSLHYKGRALDFRTSVVKDQAVREHLRDGVFEELNGFPYADRFEPENAPHKLFDVVLHSTHLHVEYDPAEQPVG